MKVIVVFFGLSTMLLAGVGLAGQEEPERELRPRRLYFGAPPATPHTTAAPMQNCLGCHGQTAGFAPETPHPTRVRCTQCHVNGAEEAQPFHVNGFQGLRPPRLDTAPTPGPPRMLHSSLLRENCLACHAPGARDSIVATPHPERSQCQLCHVPQVGQPAVPRIGIVE